MSGPPDDCGGVSEERETADLFAALGMTTGLYRPIANPGGGRDFQHFRSGLQPSCGVGPYTQPFGLGCAPLALNTKLLISEIATHQTLYVDTA